MKTGIREHDTVIASPLPDRERRHLLQFYVLPKLDYGMRLSAAGILIIVAFAAQAVLAPGRELPVLLITLPLLLVGNLLLLVRGYNLKPPHTLSRGKWERTTRDRFMALRRLEHEVRRWDESVTDLTCGRGAGGLLLVAAVIFIVGAMLAALPDTRPWAIFFVADAIVLLVPHWITGTRRGWRPIGLRQQIDALDAALDVVDNHKTPPCQVQPMFEMAGKGDQRMPIDARVFIRFPDGPESFLGLQFQVALNNVQGTKYPYLYAVIVARKDFRLIEDHLDAVRSLLQPRKRRAEKPSLLSRLSGTKPRALTISKSREKDVDVIVIRQKTTKTSGYHTDANAIRWIAASAWSAATTVLRGEGER